MSDITSYIEDAFRVLHIRAHAAMSGAAERAKEQRGQTAAEYMGILLIVSLIIAALFSMGIHTKIGNGVSDLVDDIANHRGDSAKTGQ